MEEVQQKGGAWSKKHLPVANCRKERSREFGNPEYRRLFRTLHNEGRGEYGFGKFFRGRKLSQKKNESIDGNIHSGSFNWGGGEPHAHGLGAENSKRRAVISDGAAHKKNAVQSEG